MEKKCLKQRQNVCRFILRYLKMLGDSGVKRIKSREFSEMIQIPSATIRRDFPTLVNWSKRLWLRCAVFN